MEGLSTALNAMGMGGAETTETPWRIWATATPIAVNLKDIAAETLEPEGGGESATTGR